MKLIHSGGRSRREAKKYYGITSAAGVKESLLEPAVDPVQMLKYLCNEENGELKERADYVRNRISSEMFATLINNMPEDIAEELKNIEGYGIFFGTELPDGSKIEPKIVEVEKEVVKEFLISRRNEVTKNMKLDYTFDRQLELEREDAREEGLEEGRKEGRKEGREEGRKEGHEEGREEGKLEGIQEGQQLVNKLITLLLSDGRTEDLKKSASDKEYQIQLLKEYGLM